MDHIKVKVSGDKQVQLALRDLIRDLGELKVMQQIAEEASRLASRFAPKRTGRLAISIRGNRAKTRAVVTAGRGFSRRYAGVINYGFPRRNIEPAHFMQRASRAMEPRVASILDREIDRYIERKNFK